MVDIDERVVSMKFDSSDFEKKSKSTLNTLDKINDKMTFKDAANGDVLERIADNVEKMAHKSYNIIDMWVEKIKNNIINKFEAFLKENTIGQLQAGWSKYADMTTSVATLKSQGYAMDKITEQLERLNYFTDETSYNFTDMVREIGKFTASGQSLEDATTAMMGIAEWAALSGKNASDASRAMYQLSQALGAGQMRLQDYKSVQNLNMDTIEFRKNAIEAAIAAGTLKDNLNGTYTSLLNNKVTFTLQNFTESLTQGKWFNTEVMMTTYKKYSEAVDEIRAIVEEGEFINAEGVRDTFETTADAIRVVKKNNEILYKKFRDQNDKLTSDDIDAYLKKWKKIEKVTDETVDNFAEINNITKEQAQEELSKEYTQYLQEYAEVFKDTEESAEEALDDWHSYVSSYGIKAFSASQEAKTFAEAIESAKDAASTVWVGIYQDIFGDYEEAKELWTDLANALYEIFVSRLSNIEEIFDYWKTGYEKEKQEEIDALKKEFESLRNKSYLTEYEQQRLNAINNQLVEMEARMEAGLYNGRRLLFQGLYAFGGGLKNALLYFRKAWSGLFEENEAGKRLLSFSEKLRINAFQFYTLIQDLGEKTDFFKNIAQGIRNLLSPIKAVWTIITNVIGQFLPQGESAKNILVTLSEKFRDLTAKMVPSQAVMQKIARILRGIVAIIKLIVKIAIGLWKTILEPIASALFEVFTGIFDIIGEVLAAIGDAFFNFEEAITPVEAMTKVANGLKNVLLAIFGIIGLIVKSLVTLLAPAFNVVKNTITKLVSKIKSLFGNGPNGGDLLNNIAEGFQNIGERAKKAWTEGETLADVFNRFKGGTGISNFIQMLGSMLDNLVSRIGRTIAAILGLDEEIAKSKIGEGIETAKDIIVQAFTIIKWLYTNVIRPVFSIIFQGISQGLKDIGEAFKTGDFNQILDTIKRVFKTLGAMEIVKLLRMITKILGAGGLLKVTRNLAGTIKQIGNYFKAKKLNEFSSGLLKIAIALTLVVAGMTALTFLPIENLEKLGPLLMHAGIALMSMVGALILLSIATTLMREPLRSVTGFLSSILALMLTTIAVIYLMKRAFESLYIKDEEGNVTGFDFKGLIILLVGALSPILAVAAAIGVVGMIARRVARTRAIKDFGVAIAGIGIAMAGLAFGLNQMIDFVTSVSFDEGLAAVIAMIGLIAVLTLAGIALSRFMAVNKKANWKTGMAIAIAMAAMVLSIALVVIPCLDDMVQNRDKFPQYLEALTIFAATMLAIGTSFFLMTTGTKNGFHIFMAGIVFSRMTTIISNFILPLIQELQLVDLDRALPAVAALGVFVIAVGFALRLVLDGIANCLTAITKLKAKQWIAIILSTAAAIAAVMALSHIFTEAGAELDLVGILAPLGVVIAICVAFGLFARSITKTLGSGDKTIGNVIKVFEWMIALFSVVTLGIVGIIEIANFQFKDNEKAMIVTMCSYIIAILVTIVTMTASFGLLVKSLAKSLGSSNQKIQNVMTALRFMMKFMFLFILEFTIAISGILQIGYFQYDGNEGNMITIMMSYVVAICLSLFIMSKIFVSLINNLATSLKSVKEDKFTQIVTILKIMMAFISILMDGFMLTVIGVGLTYDGNPLGSIIPFVGLLLSISLGMFALKEALLQLFEGVAELTTGMTKTQFEKFEKIIPIIKSMMIIITAMLGIIGTSIVLIGLTYNGGYAWMSIIAAVSMLLMVLGTLNGIVKVFKEITNIVKDAKFTQDVFKQVEIIMITLVSLVSLLTIVSAAVASSMSDRIGITLANALIELGSVIVLLWGMTKAFKQIIPLLDWGRAPDNKEIVAMVIVFLSMFIVIGEITGIIEKLASYDLTSWETGLAFAIAAVGLLWALGNAFSKILYTYENILKSVSVVNNNSLVSLLIIFAGLTLVTIALGVLVGNMDSLAGVHWSTALATMAGLALVIAALAFMTKVLQAFTVANLGTMFMAQAGQVALGILAISAALVAFAGAAYLIKKVFGIGESIDEGIAQGIETNSSVAEDAAGELVDDITDKVTDKKHLNSHSPSKTFAEYGKYIDQGLAKGITSNRKYAINAAGALATYTNEEFCDELGIASPSKVFYENGRFVVRGFINGVNSESNKAKSAGLDMADGFGEGLDQIMDDTKNTFKGIWSDLGKDIDIAEEMKKGMGDLPGLFENSLFGESGEKLTEEEEEELAKLEKKSREMGSLFAQYYGNEYSRMIELQEKKSKSGTNKLTSNLTDSLVNAFGGALGSDSLNGILDGKLGDIGSKITGFFGSDDMLGALTGIFVGGNGNTGIVDTVAGAVEDRFGIKLTGEGGLSDTINGLIGDNTISDSANNLGQKIGESIYNGIQSKFGNTTLGKLFIGVTGSENEQHNKSMFQSWWLTNRKNYNYTEEQESRFKELVNNAIHEYGTSGDLEHEDIENYANYFFNTLGDYWKDVQKLTISKGFSGPLDVFDIGEGIGQFILPDDIFHKFLNTRDFNETLSNAFADVGFDAYGNEYANYIVDGISTSNEELISLIESGYGDGIGGTETIELQKFVKYLQNSDGTLKKDLINQINPIITKNGKHLLNLSSKGEYILKKAMEFGKTTTKGTYELNHDFSELLEYEKEYDKKVSTSTKNIEYQVNALLTNEHYEQYGHFTDEQITLLFEDLGKLGLLKENETGNFQIITPDEKIGQIITLLQRITNDGLKVYYDNTVYQDETRLDQLKSNGITYKKLKELNDSGQIGELLKLTGGKFLNQYEEQIQEEYSNLVNFMNTREYDEIAATDKGKKKYYESLRAYYRNYFSEILKLEPEDLPDAHSYAKDEAEAEAKRKEEERKAKEKAEREAKEKAVLEATKDLVSKYEKETGILIKDADPFSQMFNSVMKSLPQVGIDRIFDFFKLAMDNKWIEIDEDGVMHAVKFSEDILEAIRKAWNINSPSKETEELMKYFMLGLNVGVDENTQEVLNSLSTATDLMTDEVAVGLQAMVNSLDDDAIRPTITPVYDDELLQNRISSLNNSFDSVSPLINATVNSFKNDTPNYTSQFDTLANGIVGTNTLLQSLCDTLEEGGLIDVNVIPEFDDTGLFNLVINKGKENWKRTGQQQFRW